jgi:uncharacterized delta-60 repeat protein
MKHFVYSLITLLQVGFLCNAAQVGFNRVGYVANVPDGSFVYISSVIDAQGRIIAVGQTDSVNDDSHGLIVRYKEDGSLDTTFNGTGFINTENGTNSSIYYSVALDVQGRIVVAGQTDYTLNNSNKNGLIARYNENGSLDTTFNNGAGFITNVPNNSSTYNSVAVDNQGRILVVGRTDDNNAFIARFNQNGTALDNNFGTNGVVTNVPNNSFIYYSVALDVQGRIVVAGQTDSVNDDSHGLIVRYKEDGSLDTTFNNGTGFINTENGTNSSIYYSVALDVQGRIVTVGQTDFDLDLDEENHGLIVRHNENGSLDTTFNGTGFIISKAINSFHYISLVIDTQGRIVVAGQTNNNGALIARFKSDGTLDTYFNQISAQSYNKVLIDNNNRIITVGLNFDLNGIIARFLSNGVLDAESNWNLQNFRESNNINKVSIGLLG